MENSVFDNQLQKVNVDPHRIGDATPCSPLGFATPAMGEESGDEDSDILSAMGEESDILSPSPPAVEIFTRQPVVRIAVAEGTNPAGAH